MNRLLNAVGFSQTHADEVKGIYNFCQTLFNFPASFIVPITVSIIPSITGYLTVRNNRAALQVEESAVRITALLGLPCGVGLAVAARPILQMLSFGSYGAEDLAALCAAGGTGILLDAPARDALLTDVALGGVLPKKSFSMGAAREKRYYLECRALTEE